MPTNTSGESGGMESGGKGLNEKRVLIRGSVPTIHCANKVPEKRESRDQDRRRTKAVSVKSIHFVFSFSTSIVATNFSAISIVRHQKY